MSKSMKSTKKNTKNSIIVKLDKDGLLTLQSLAGLIDITKAESYNTKTKKDGTIIVKLYDKKGKLIKPYA